MGSAFYLADDVTLASALSFGPTAAGDTSATQTLHFWYDKGTAGGSARYLSIQAADPATGFDHGIDWLNETWVEARVNGGANPGADGGYVATTTDWYRLGNGSVLGPVPDLPGNCAYYVEIRLHPPMRDGAPTEVQNFQLRAMYGDAPKSSSGVASFTLTLDTGAATTDTAANVLPAGALIKGIGFKVMTTITTATSYTIGDGTTAARFVASQSSGQLTAGATGVGLQHWQGSVSTDAAGPVQATADKLRVTCNTTPAAGALLFTVAYELYVAPG